ncbi:MAG: DNA-directed RNA polymerase, partial [Plesiomonas sp.]
ANDFSDVLHAISPFNVLADAHGEYLAAEQLRLEHEAYTMGEARFLKALTGSCERGEMDANPVFKPMLELVVPAIEKAITEFMETKGRGRPHVAKKYLAQLSPDAAAFITVKTLLQLFAKEDNLTLQRAGTRIARNLEDEVQFGRIRQEESKFWKTTVSPNLAKRKGDLFKREFLKAVEHGMLEDGKLSEYEPWAEAEAYHVGVKMIELCISAAGLCSVETQQQDSKASSVQTFVSLTEEWSKKLTTRAGALAGVSPMFQPCVVPPKPWTSVQGGGYWAKGRRPLNLIRVGSKKALMRYNEIEMPQVYSAINIIQNTAWKINPDVLRVVNEIVHWDNCPVEDVPSADAMPKPKCPEEIAADPELLKKWKRNAAGLYRKEKARQSRRLSLEFALEQANKFADYDAIWFPYNMDWRGRVYAVSMFNPQGNDMTKGLLTFAEKIALGEEGAYWLAVHGSNCAGVDKVSLDDRVKWVHDNEEHILASARDPLGYTWWAEQDSSSFCLLAFCFDWLGYVESGRSVNYESSLPLAFDGTCSGLQHFSAMLRDEVGGAAVNLLPSDKPQDIYGIVAQKVVIELNKLLLAGSEDETKVVEDKKTGELIEKVILGDKTLAAQWLEYGVTRGVTKRSVMTLAYGSKKFGFSEQVMEDTVQPALDAGKGNMFTMPKQAATFLAGLIWDAVGVTVIAAVQAMEWLQKAANLVSSKVV